MNNRFKYKDLEAIRVGKFSNRVNTTCLIFRINNTVIDTGPPNQWKKVKEFLDEKKIESLLITHYHEDHSGNGFEIKKEYGTKIFTNELSYKYCQEGFIVEFYRRVVWGKPKNFQAEILGEKIETENGLLFLPIKTPGHSEDMTCYLEKNRGWLFTGDLYISSKMTHARIENNAFEEMNSIKKILDYDFETVFCSHRGLLEDGKKTLEKKWNYLNNTYEKVIELKKKGYSLDETFKKIMGKEDLFSFMTMFYFTKKQFIKSFWDNI
ncbi:MAG: MBL fold metallo-hydrolase [Candidatus Sericytochromatia bacterium]